MPRAPRSSLVPHLNGVAPSCVSLPSPRAGKGSTGCSVVEFLIERLPGVSAQRWRQRVESGLVLHEDGSPLALDAPYEGGTRVYYYRDVPDETPVPFEESVVYQDAHLVVADKPHFLPVTPGGRFVQETLLVRLQRRLGLPDLAPLHRIDRETAGLVLFAVRPEDRGMYHALFSGRSMQKTYEAIAAHTTQLTWPHAHRSHLEDHPTDFFRMREAPVDANAEANSETHIQLLEQRGAWARYELRPITGKRHQLRVHMNALGLPLAGDQLYPEVLHGPDAEEDFAVPLQLLAKHLSFTDPITGKHRQFESARSLAWPEEAP